MGNHGSMTVPEDIVKIVLHRTKIIREEMVLLMRNDDGFKKKKKMRNDERDKIQKLQS